MGFTALRTGLASLNCPYDNDYINENFSLDMLIPKEEKLDTYKNYMKKMIISSSGSKRILSKQDLQFLQF